MDWNIYWTILAQIAIASFLLAIPVGVFCLIVAGAFRRDNTKRNSTEKIF